ncbi:MAG TPA: sulfite exporter TauE/SafE family protein [Acidimicrobiales bacterium]|nr:sulfite exporter TauE/SafE family protein [Acidimicrobiales bacterium]
MQLSGLDYLAVAGASLAAGMVNALAGGGTLISFPTLVGIGVPAVPANVTNTVALLPGYLGGSWAQRDDLRPQLGDARVLAATGAVGGLAGSVLLVMIPPQAFRLAVPYLIVASCLLLLGQERARSFVGVAAPAPGSPGAGVGQSGTDQPGVDPPGVGADTDAGAVASAQPAPTRPGAPGLHPALAISVFAAAVYGGFFGAGLGIVLLAVLGLFHAGPLARVNALKQALSFVINVVAAVFFAFSGHVRWQLVPVMAAASILGGFAGGRLAGRISGDMLRKLVVVAGLGAAAALWAA